MDGAGIVGLIGSHGLAVLVPVAVVEGPVVSVIAGYLVRLNLIGLTQTLVLLVLADLAGDLLLYGLGRSGRVSFALHWLRRFGVTRDRLAWLIRAFRARGGRILILGKLTHSAGFAVLLAAGLARMPPGRFLALNLLATVPKVCALVAIGWAFGEVSAKLGNWMLGASLLALLCLGLWRASLLIGRTRMR
jgi:membrane protein DedA with SNARE-associated domain